MSAEFIVISFDGWSTHRNESILRMVLSTLGDSFTIQTYCLLNRKMTDENPVIMSQIFYQKLFLNLFGP